MCLLGGGGMGGNVLQYPLPQYNIVTHFHLTRSLREPGGSCTKSMEAQNLVWNGLIPLNDGILELFM